MKSKLKLLIICTVLSVITSCKRNGAEPIPILGMKYSGTDQTIVNAIRDIGSTRHELAHIPSSSLDYDWSKVVYKSTLGQQVTQAVVPSIDRQNFSDGFLLADLDVDGKLISYSTTPSLGKTDDQISKFFEEKGYRIKSVKSEKSSTVNVRSKMSRKDALLFSNIKRGTFFRHSGNGRQLENSSQAIGCTSALI